MNRYKKLNESQEKGKKTKISFFIKRETKYQIA